jgi:hypothetical protein
MSSATLVLPAAPAVPSLADEALLALVLHATRPPDGAAAVRALVRLAEEGEAGAPRLLLALAHEAAVDASRQEDVPASEAGMIAGHVLAALGRELRGGDPAQAATARDWLLSLAADGVRARAARA